MTAHAMTGDEQKSLDAGMNDHVTKPIDPEQLFGTLRKWIKPVAERTVAPEGPIAVDRLSETDKRVPEEDELPESLPGFDLDAGLSRLMGNQRLYRKLLLDFSTNYTEAANQVRQALHANDFELAHSLVHNLKGLAGNLAATDLQAAAVDMEGMVKGKTAETISSRELNRKFTGLENALEQALEAVQNLGRPAAENRVEPSVDLPADIPVAKMQAAAERIRAAAEMGDVMQIQAIAEELKTESDAMVPFCDELISLAEDFDLDGIQRFLSELGR